MISAIILTWNSEKYIKQCIEHLVEDAEGEKLEIIVVDNGSKDGTVNLVRELGEKKSDMHLIPLERNMGTTYPRNLALEKSRGEYILFLDSDVEIRKGTLAKLLDEIKDDNKVGIICPKLVYSDGTLQMSFKKFPTLKTKILKILGSRFTFFQKLADKDELYEGLEKKLYPDYSISACWLTRKALFEKIGLFDEKIFYAPEDVDFCLRTWLKGYRVLYFPSVSAVHHTQRISYRNKKIALSHLFDLIYYFHKHEYWFSREKIYRKIKDDVRSCYIKSA